MNTKRNIFLWVLYDFANSIVSIVFFLYFAQWVVVDRGLPDIYFNLTFTIAGILLLLTVPITGFLLGTYFRRITGLRVTTLFMSLFYGASALSTIADQGILALIFFALGLYVYLLTFTFYTPLLNDISDITKRGRVSGFGTAANYLGQVIGLVIVLPFSNGVISLFHSSARAETLLPAVIAFTVLALPMLIWFHEPKKPKATFYFKNEARLLLSETKKLFLFPGVGLFLISYFLFNDAVLTASNNFPIFLEQVWGVPDSTKTYIILGILIMSCVGGLVSGIIADKFGHKRTLIFVTAGFVVIFPLLGFVKVFWIFCVSTTLMGLWYGSTWTVSRSVMSYVAPPQGYNLAFGYFGLAERASSLIGPLVWGSVVTGLVSIGTDRYRFAMLAVTGFIIIGILFLLRVRDDRSSI